MKRWIAFLIAFVLVAVIHEGMHALTATIFDEYQAFNVKPFGFEVMFKTPVEERSGVHWAFISGASNLLTLLVGYLLLIFGGRFARLCNGLLKASIFYLTLISLLFDPFNLSIGPLIYGGDANGIAAGLGISRVIVQVFFLVVLLINRELVAQKLFPMYGVQVDHFLFKPLIRLPD